LILSIGRFYFGFYLYTLQQKPAGVSQDKFSAGFSGGFLRDMPINKDRTHAIAVGLGSLINYIQKPCHNRNGGLPVYCY
jgi:hypothetical protein